MIFPNDRRQTAALTSTAFPTECLSPTEASHAQKHGKKGIDRAQRASTRSVRRELLLEDQRREQQEHRRVTEAEAAAQQVACSAREALTKSAAALQQFIYTVRNCDLMRTVCNADAVGLSPDVQDLCHLFRQAQELMMLGAPAIADQVLRDTAIIIRELETKKVLHELIDACRQLCSSGLFLLDPPVAARIPKRSFPICSVFLTWTQYFS